MYEGYVSTDGESSLRKRNLGKLSPDMAYTLIKYMAEDMKAIDNLLKFVKGHAKMAREMTKEEVETAFNIISVREVMDG